MNDQISYGTIDNEKYNKLIEKKPMTIKLIHDINDIFMSHLSETKIKNIIGCECEINRVCNKCNNDVNYVNKLIYNDDNEFNIIAKKLSFHDKKSYVTNKYKINNANTQSELFNNKNISNELINLVNIVNNTFIKNYAPDVNIKLDNHILSFNENIDNSLSYEMARVIIYKLLNELRNNIFKNNYSNVLNINSDRKDINNVMKYLLDQINNIPNKRYIGILLGINQYTTNDKSFNDMVYSNTDYNSGKYDIMIQKNNNVYKYHDIELFNETKINKLPLSITLYEDDNIICGKLKLSMQYISYINEKYMIEEKIYVLTSLLCNKIVGNMNSNKSQ